MVTDWDKSCTRSVNGLVLSIGYGFNTSENLWRLTRTRSGILHAIMHLQMGPMVVEFGQLFMQKVAQSFNTKKHQIRSVS